MTIYTLSHGPLKLDVSDQGGVIEGFWRDTTPLLRPGKKSGVATDASCFPLVPFANRVSGNRFVWQGVSINCNRMLSGMRTIYTAMAGWASGNVSRAAMIACVWCMNISAVFITIG